jgi:transcriptional regulator with XRE-family HTH domain
MKSSHTPPQGAKSREDAARGVRPTPKGADPVLMAKLVAAEQDIRNRLSKNVHALRRASRLTQKAAALRGGIHWRHLQKIEHGEVNATVQTLASLTLALALDVADLFGVPADSATATEHGLPSVGDEGSVPAEFSLHAIAEQMVKRWRAALRPEQGALPGMGHLIDKLDIALKVEGAFIAAARAEERARTLAEVSAEVLAAFARISGGSSTP